ncbi:YceI family protein [Patescibacteria group bacterium]|nr:YceI family protein [Patescibacteria group bacterium]
MKKTFILLLAIFVLSGCAAKNTNEKSENSQASSTDEEVIAKTTETNNSEVNEIESNTETENNLSANINLDLSTMNWNGKKFTGSEHNGTIEFNSGTLDLDNNRNIIGGEFIINMNSLKDSDGSENLEKHLKGEDFFQVETYPEAKLKITHIEPNGELKEEETKYTITADLTIKEITRDIVFEATGKLEKNTLNANAEFNIDRTRWNIKYGSGKFFKGLGDKVINDEMSFKINLISLLPEVNNVEKEETTNSTNEINNQE